VAALQAADPTPDALELVRTYADAMLDKDKGRDHYGASATPLFATVLDRKTYRIPESTASDLYRARVPQEFEFIGNPHADQNLLQVLYALNAANTAIHEFYRPWIYWDKSFGLAEGSRRCAVVVDAFRG
jgi:hypothetical protein